MIWRHPLFIIDCCRPFASPVNMLMRWDVIELIAAHRWEICIGEQIPAWWQNLCSDCVLTFNVHRHGCKQGCFAHIGDITMTGVDVPDGKFHIDVKMSTMASQITSLTVIYSTIYSGTDQRKHQSSASLAFVRGIHQWSPLIPRTKGQ